MIPTRLRVLCHAVLRTAMLGTLVALLLHQGAHLSMAGEFPQGDGAWTVQIRIVDSQSQEPIENVLVRVSPAGTQDYTDGTGWARLGGTYLGEATVFAEKVGYVPLRLPKLELPSSSGIPLFLLRDADIRATLSLARTGALHGRVIDAQGDPLSGVAVTPIRAVFDNHGEKTWSALSTVKTDDRGEFRYGSLIPALYSLKVDASVAAQPERPLQSFSPLYYPAKDPDRSDGMRVDSGLDTLVGDIVLAPEKTVTIEVAARFESGEYLPGTVFLCDRGEIINSFSLSKNRRSVNVIPRQYEALFIPAPALRLPSATIYLDIVTDNQMVDFQVRKGAEVRMIVRDISGRPLSGIQARLGKGSPPLILNSVGSLLGVSTSLRSDDSGVLVIPSVSEGDYRVDVVGIPAGMVWKSFHDQEGREVDSDKLSVRAGETLVFTIVLDSASERMDGIVRDSHGNPVPGAVIVMLPQNESVCKTVVPVSSDADGRFRLSGPPGAYTVYAWRELDGAAYKNSAFMGQYVGQGRTLSLDSNEKQPIDLIVADE